MKKVLVIDNKTWVNEVETGCGFAQGITSGMINNGESCPIGNDRITSLHNGRMFGGGMSYGEGNGHGYG
jgi:hypothetical protein